MASHFTSRVSLLMALTAERRPSSGLVKDTNHEERAEESREKKVKTQNLIILNFG